MKAGKRAGADSSHRPRKCIKNICGCAYCVRIQQCSVNIYLQAGYHCIIIARLKRASRRALRVIHVKIAPEPMREPLLEASVSLFVARNCNDPAR